MKWYGFQFLLKLWCSCVGLQSDLIGWLMSHTNWFKSSLQQNKTKKTNKQSTRLVHVCIRLWLILPSILCLSHKQKWTIFKRWWNVIKHLSFSMWSMTYHNSVTICHGQAKDVMLIRFYFFPLQSRSETNRFLSASHLRLFDARWCESPNLSHRLSVVIPQHRYPV